MRGGPDKRTIDKIRTRESVIPMTRESSVILVIFFCAAAVLLLGGCSDPGAYIDVLQGNYAFSRGEYQESNAAYLKVLDRNVFTAPVSYNLGNVYHLLGEFDAAIDEWNRAADTEDSELLHRIAFNKGVLYYEAGQYSLAWNSFKSALMLMPGDIDSKVNLEYSLQKINAKSTVQQLDEGREPERSPGDEVKRILEYIRRKEQVLFERGLVRDPDERDPRDW